ncbi:DUF177 domain-containing protein [bacterium]|nr:DUF177 domain-containing protein [bacterium]
MKLRLPSLHEGINALEETLDPGEIGLDTDVFVSPVAVKGTADDEDTLVDVRLEIRTTGHYTCDRCAAEFDRPFDVTSRIEILRRDPEDSDEEEAEGLVFVGSNGTEADLSQEIVEAILLDLPLQMLCRDDCKGLCPFCYTDWNEGTCEHFAEYGPGADAADNDSQE